MPLQIECRHLAIRHRLPGRIDAWLSEGINRQSRRGGRAADVAQQHFPTPQRLAGPVQANLREQAMLNRIPFRAAPRIVAHCHRQAQLIAQLGLQLLLPQPWATARA